MNLKCFKVMCISNDGRTHNVGVMAKDIDSAKESARKSLLEGKHIIATSVKAYECERI